MLSIYKKLVYLVSYRLREEISFLIGFIKLAYFFDNKLLD